MEEERGNKETSPPGGPKQSQTAPQRKPTKTKKQKIGGERR